MKEVAFFLQAEAPPESAASLPAEPHWPRAPFALEVDELWPLVSVLVCALGVVVCLALGWRARRARELRVDDPLAERRRLLAAPAATSWLEGLNEAGRLEAVAASLRARVEDALDLDPELARTITATELAGRVQKRHPQLAAALEQIEQGRYAGAGVSSSTLESFVHLLRDEARRPEKGAAS